MLIMLIILIIAMLLQFAILKTVILVKARFG
jgi:hypothetical protein